ncbi:MAG: hypothetical protein ACYS8X_05400 [Planctomycetota bacterium]|jgi:hypothetical protein
MNEAAIRKDLLELNATLANSPIVGGGEKAIEGSYEPTGTAQEPNMAECLAQIRLKMKYLVFDLEATRRENRYLRQMLEIHRKRDRKDGGIGGEKDW